MLTSYGIGTQWRVEIYKSDEKVCEQKASKQ